MKRTERKDVGGAIPRFEKPYVIVNPNGEFFRDYTACVPMALHAFTDRWQSAWKFATREDANAEMAKLSGRIADGSGKAPKGCLRVAKAEFTVVG